MPLPKTVSGALALVLICASGAALADPVTVTDQAGRTVTLPKPAERVVTIPMPMASTLIAVDGGTTRLVGMNPMSKSAIMEGVLGKIFPQAKDIPSDVTAPTFVPNIEELAATNPDLVVQWAHYGADTIDPITNAGLPVALIALGTEEMTKTYHQMLADLIGKPERGEVINGWRDGIAAEMLAKTKDLTADQRPKVLYLGRAMESLTASGTKGNYNAWYMNLAGGVNASADIEGNGTTISPEQIAAWDPDVILLNSFEPKLGVERIYNDPILSLTKAAQGKKVYKMPLGGYRWDPPSQESPLTWMWLGNLLHPELFSYDLRAEMQKAYKLIYNYDLTNEDMDGILWTDMQGDATNYAQFKVK